MVVQHLTGLVFGHQLAGGRLSTPRRRPVVAILVVAILVGILQKYPTCTPPPLLVPLLPTRHNASFAFCFVHFGQQPPQRRPGRAQRLPCHHRGGVVHGLADFVHLALQIFHVRRRHGAASAFLALRRWRRHIVLFDGHRHFFQRFQKVGDLNGVDVCRTTNKETRKQGGHVQLTIWSTKNNTTTTTQPTPTNAYHPIVSASLAPLVNCPWCRWQWFPPPCLLVGATVSVGCSVVQWPCCTPLRACGPLRCVVVLLTTLAKGRRTGVKRVKRVKRVVMKNMKNMKNNKKVNNKKANNKQKAQRTTTQRHRQQQQQHFSYLHRFPCRATRFE